MIRRYPFLCVALLLSVPACTVLEPPATVSDRTKVDERLGLGAELAYTTATKLGTILAQAGLIDPAKFKALDGNAYSALLAVRNAYKAGNAADYAVAVQQLQAAVLDINSLAGASNGR